jgi:hypothetical protein
MEMLMTYLDIFNSMTDYSDYDEFVKISTASGVEVLSRYDVFSLFGLYEIARKLQIEDVEAWRINLYKDHEKFRDEKYNIPPSIASKPQSTSVTSGCGSCGGGQVR